VSETWVGLFCEPSAPKAQAVPLHTTMSALGTSVAVADDPVIVPVGHDPIPLIVKVFIDALMPLMGHVMFHAAGEMPAIVTYALSPL
jgi:hypothetical protein